MITLLQITDLLLNTLITVLIVQFVLFLLLAFNVVSIHNNVVGAIWRSLNAILDPILAPIRRIMPDTGAIDFSPMVLIVLIRILQIVVGNLAVSSLA